MSDQITNAAELDLVREAVKEYVWDGDGGWEAVLAAHDAEVRAQALWRAATAAVVGGEVGQEHLPLAATRSDIAAWLRARARAERGEA